MGVPAQQGENPSTSGIRKDSSVQIAAHLAVRPSKGCERDTHFPIFGTNITLLPWSQ